MRFSAGNESNRVVVNPDASGGVSIADPVRTVRAGSGCKATSRTSAVCTGTITRVSIAGSGGNDVIDAAFMTLPVTLDGSEGNDTLIGGADNDSLDGDDGNDTIAGGAGNDNVTADSGNDAIDGGPGADTLHGGAGTDTVDYSGEPSPVTVDLDGNADDGGPNEQDRVEADVERVVGSSFGDHLTAISGTHTLDGGPGDDVLTGGTGVDALIGGPGNDMLNGGVGNDSLLGGDGIDLADYAGRFDPVTLDLTSDRAYLDRGSGTRRVRETDTLNSIENGRGTSHADVLIGGPGPNSLSGGPGNDTLDGRFGGDVLIGGGGRDTADYSARHAPVTVTLDDQQNDGAAGEGDDVSSSVEDVIGGSAGDQLTGSARRNHLVGGDGRDRLIGLAGGDVLDGGPAADRLEGGDGGDTLIGGAGLDTLIGGASNDVFDALDGRRDAVECDAGVDRVTHDRVDRVDRDCERLTPPRR